MSNQLLGLFAAEAWVVLAGLTAYALGRHGERRRFRAKFEPYTLRDER